MQTISEYLKGIKKKVADGEKEEKQPEISLDFNVTIKKEDSENDN